MNILMIGATGMIGKEIVSEAAKRGHKVLAASRQATAGGQANVTPLALDINDTAALKSAVKDVDLVISAVSPRNGGNPTDEAVTFTKSLLEAVETKRLILVGGAGSLFTPDGTPVVDVLPDEYKAEGAAMLAAFNLLNESDANFTVQAPALEIYPGDKTGGTKISERTVVFNGKGESKISTKDFADVLINEAENPQFAGKIFNAAYA